MTPRISHYDSVVFFTGAGISAESGVPTYRGAGGIWKEYDYERYACQTAFEEDPQRVWDFHNYRRELVGRCQPNAAHLAIARAQREHPRVTLITQNIDGLHTLAGSTEVLELHGCLWRIRCDACGRREDNRESPFTALACPCGDGTMRPDITWFGDVLDQDTFEAAFQAVLGTSLLVSVGTSGVVHPAARLPELALKAGATLVEVNPEQTEASTLHHHHLRGKASERLPELL